MSEAKTAAVYSAMSAVQAALSKVGVGKNATNQQQHFKYRAWDDVQNALAPILAEHKLLIIPRVSEREESRLQTKSGANLFRVILRGEIAFVSGEDGSSYAYPAMGEAMDSGDKATSKAITMMVKYAVTHGLCIPLAGVADGDAETAPETQEATISKEQQETLHEYILDTESDEAQFLAWLKVESMDQVPESSYNRALKQLKRKLAKQQEAIE